MDDFLCFFEGKRKVYPMNLNIHYINTYGWIIEVWKARETDIRENIMVPLVCVSNSDLEPAFTMARKQLTEYFARLENGEIEKEIFNASNALRKLFNKLANQKAT